MRELAGRLQQAGVFWSETWLLLPLWLTYTTRTFYFLEREMFISSAMHGTSIQ